MIKLEIQVCSLELAKKLKELGVSQDSFWYWVEHYVSRKQGRVWELFQFDEDDKVNPHISAFTVAELGILLPAWVRKRGICYHYRGTQPDSTVKNDWYGGYTSSRLEKTEHELIYLHGVDTEANVRAKMLIYLLENELVKANK